MARIRNSGVYFNGVCSVGTAGVCVTEDGGARPITAVWDEDGLQVDVCSACLQAKLEDGSWVRGERMFQPVVGEHAEE